MTSDLWNIPATRSLEESERLKMDRKLLKPQVERRRRERMNRSLESLRTLLLQSPESGSQRRVEKAEILEHTVLFLQSSTTEAKKPQSLDEASEPRQFLNGFSACLHKAALFLQMEGEAQGLQGSLSASLYQHLSRPHPPMPGPAPASAWVRISPRTSVPEKNQHPAVRTRKNTHLSQPYRIPLRYTHPSSLGQRHGNTHATSMPTLSQQGSVRQHVWRPWP